MPLPTYEAPTHENLEPDTYDAFLLDIEERDGVDPQTGQPTKYWIWTFELDVDGRKVSRTAASSARLTPKSKGGKWAFAIKGSPLTFLPGQPFDWGQIIGKPCRVDIIPDLKDGQIFDKIDGVKPAGRRRPQVEGPKYEANGQPVEDIADAPF